MEQGGRSYKGLASGERERREDRRVSAKNGFGFGFGVLVMGAAGCAALEATGEAPEPSRAVEAALPEFNARVLELVATYPDGGFGGYAWPARKGTSGTTRDLRAGGELIANGGEGNHCVGVTIEVFWRALEECPGGVAAAMSAKQARAFKRTWYVPVDGGMGAAEAIVVFGVGERVVRMEDARPGDFLQGWRADGLGHSAVFLGWQRDEAGGEEGQEEGERRIVGVEYWSSQPWTDGIGRASTTIGVDEASFDPQQVYLARARCPTVKE
ncbi:MAG TPA: hypothetical protein VM261_10485 [Kofleriaceae bacterium]|nr:hypothetical protein [Kofleriaceae bacterium]